MAIDENSQKLTPHISELGAWALSLGTTIGWGSLIVTSNTYLIEAGLLGSLFGLCLCTFIMLILAKNYHLLMNCCPDAGGIYSYAKYAYGHDRAFISAWFLSITYFAVLWANATSLPLFSRIFFGNLFQFGYCYTLLGYKIFLGEVLLTVTSLIIIGYLCTRFKKFISVLLISMGIFIIAGIGICFIGSFWHHGTFQNMSPYFIPNRSYFMQIIHILCISPWAFIGFENISHAVEEFKFPKDKAYKVLSSAVITAALLYLMVIILSTSVHPDRYANWLEYIRDLKNCSGFEALPTFYAAHHYLGNFGIALLAIVLLSLVLSSLIGNIYALSRLFYALAKDRVIKYKFAKLNRYSLPQNAIWLIVCISVFIPLFGRTAISWIIDITTICATIIYAFISAIVYEVSKRENNKEQKLYGLLGFIAMICFGIYLLMPNYFTGKAIETESYMLFTTWCILGFIYFRNLIIKNNKFGNSIVVWVVLLTIMLLTSLTWIMDSTEKFSGEAMESVYKHYTEEKTDNTHFYVDKKIDQLQNDYMFYMCLGMGIVAFSVFLLLNNYSIILKRAKASEDELDVAREKTKKLETELDIAKTIQNSVLPVAYPNNKRFSLYATMDGAKKVGGDFYDFFEIDSTHEALIIADVSGKGITAALYMMNAKALIKELVLIGKSLTEVVLEANKRLCENNTAKMFLTLFMAILNTETGELVCVNAGHNPPLIKHKGKWEYYKMKHSMALGVSKKVKPTEVTFKLDHTDMLFIYTDGVTEAMNSEKKFFGEKRLLDFLLNQNETSPSKIIDNLKNELHTFAGKAPQSDDITMIMVSYK